MSERSVVSILTRERGCCVWLKEINDPVESGELIGSVVLSNNLQEPIKSPIDGILTDIYVNGNIEGEVKESYVIAQVEKCNHEKVLESVCIECQKILSTYELRNYSMIINPDGSVLNVTRELYEQQRRATMDRMKRNRRLGLVFDLDNTLMEQTERMTGLEATKFGIPNIYIIEFAHQGIIAQHVIVLRPQVKDVLKRLVKDFDLFVYTNGLREYAKQVVKVLDPDGSLFGDRILARDDHPKNRSENNATDNFVHRSKDIDLIMPGFDRMGIAIDDSNLVWKRGENVIHIPGFFFWDTFYKVYNGLSKESSEEEKKMIMFKNMNTIVNNSDMECLYNTLHVIHDRYYGNNRDDLSTEQVMREIRGAVLLNTTTYFDGPFYGKEEYDELCSKAEELGTKVVFSFDQNVNYVIATNPGSPIVDQACHYPAIRVVSVHWLRQCYTFMAAMSSKGYSLRGIEKKREAYQAELPLEENHPVETHQEKKESVNEEESSVSVFDDELNDAIEASRGQRDSEEEHSRNKRSMVSKSIDKKRKYVLD